MKKFYIAALAACTALSVTGAGMESFPKMMRSKVKKERKVTLKADNDVWRAKTQVVSYWDDEAGEWVEASIFTTDYDAKGNVLLDLIENVEEETMERVTYTYNADNLKSSETLEVSEGEEFENYQQKTWEYDPIVKTLVVKNRDYMWQNDSWSLPGNCWDRNVTRDDRGVITKVEVVMLDGTPVQTQTNEIGADGKVSGITFGTWGYGYQSGELVYEPEMSFTNMTWEETDGQIYDDESFVGGANKVKSMTITDLEEEDGISADVTVTYPEGGYDMASVVTYRGMTQKSNVTYRSRENGGFHVVSQGYLAYMGMTEPVFYEEEYDYFDEYGLELEYCYSEGTQEDDVEVIEKVVGKVEYDPTYGYPLSYTRAYLDTDSGEMINDIKVEFSDYGNVSGINGIDPDSDATVEYYTIDGQRTDASAPGLYIRRQGSKTIKIMK